MTIETKDKDELAKAIFKAMMPAHVWDESLAKDKYRAAAKMIEGRVMRLSVALIQASEKVHRLEVHPGAWDSCDRAPCLEDKLILGVK